METKSLRAVVDILSTYIAELDPKLASTEMVKIVLNHIEHILVSSINKLDYEREELKKEAQGITLKDVLYKIELNQNVRVRDRQNTHVIDGHISDLLYQLPEEVLEEYYVYQMRIVEDFIEITVADRI